MSKRRENRKNEVKFPPSVPPPEALDRVREFQSFAMVECDLRKTFRPAKKIVAKFRAIFGDIFRRLCFKS